VDALTAPLARAVPLDLTVGDAETLTLGDAETLTLGDAETLTLGDLLPDPTIMPRPVPSPACAPPPSGAGSPTTPPPDAVDAAPAGRPGILRLVSVTIG